jgi:hypothetical protein
VENSYEDAKLFNIQAKDDIVVATRCLDNFIRENHALDRHFRRCDHDTEYMPTYLYLIGMQGMHHLKMHLTNLPPRQMTSMDRTHDDLVGAILHSRS